MQTPLRAVFGHAVLFGRGYAEQALAVAGAALAR